MPFPVPFFPFGAGTPPGDPFYQSDWPSAVLPRRALQGDFTAPPPFAIVNPNPDRPWHYDDWRAPSPPRPPAKTDILLPQPVTPVVQAPFFQSDWPSLAKAQPGRSDVYDTPDALLRPNPDSPWHQDDWPRTARFLPQKSDSYDPPDALLRPNPSQPWHYDDWPGAAQARGKSRSDTYNPPDALSRPNPAQPFRYDDWPRTARYGPLKSDVYDVPDALIRPPQMPFGPTEWPNARAARSFGDRTWLNDGLRISPVIAMPFALADWPSATRPVRSTPADNIPNVLVLSQTPIVIQAPDAQFIANTGRLMIR